MLGRGCVLHLRVGNLLFCHCLQDGVCNSVVSTCDRMRKRTLHIALSTPCICFPVIFFPPCIYAALVYMLRPNQEKMESGQD